MGTPAEWEVHAALTKMCQTSARTSPLRHLVSWSRRKKVSSSADPSVPNARTHRAETLTRIPRILQDAPRKEEGTRARARRERGHGGRGTCPPTPAPSTIPRITRHGPGRQPPREIAEPTPLRPREGRRTDVADSLSSVGSTTVTLRGAISREASLPISGRGPEPQPRLSQLFPDDANPSSRT